MLQNVNTILKINCVFLFFSNLSSADNFIQCREFKKLLQKIIIITKIFFRHINFLLLLKHIIMVKLTTHELRLIAEKRGIKNYQNMSREKLLSTINESDCIFENFLQNGLE